MEKVLSKAGVKKEDKMGDSHKGKRGVYRRGEEGGFNPSVNYALFVHLIHAPLI